MRICSKLRIADVYFVSLPTPKKESRIRKVIPMASYLVQASYTSEALASLVKNPENRTEIVKKVAKKLGGKLSGSWLSFGEYDLVMTVEMPDNISMASFAIAAAAGGSLKSVKTTPLISTEDAMAAVKKAATSGYKPIGAKK
jgi:uncharacterized protein with GYD domain